MTTARVAEQRWAGWQTVDTGRLVLISGSALTVAAAVAYTAWVQQQQPRPPLFQVPHVALAFGLYIAFGELA
ncbi:MAG: hypothetical protein LBV34_23305 [Nocardiopsaceae bacterium]|jgi:hypothetical protein|nr:hypothetical protein [Nocardiopsaceae bacterium]